MNGNPIWPQYLGTQSQYWDRLTMPPLNLKQTSSTTEEDIWRPREFRRVKFMAGLSPITFRTEQPNTCFPKAIVG